MGNIEKMHPGIYIKDELEVREMTSKEFSIRSGISERTISAIINGEGSITFDVAYKLSEFFGNSIAFWTNLQNAYDLYQRQIEFDKELNDDWEYVKVIRPYLVKYRLINGDEQKETIVKIVRQYANVNFLSSLNKKDLFVNLKEQKGQKKENYFYQNFWLALALNEARKKNGIPYDKTKLTNYLLEIRNMTVQNPEVFSPRLEEIFDECGISFVLLPYLTKSDIYGATKWFSKENVMLAISNRGEKADLFWFTLFHEISHVLMEHRRETLCNLKGVEDEEADRIAANLLISEKEWNAFVGRKNFSEVSIISFAKKINILPCIVIGRLHKEKLLSNYGYLDKKYNVSYSIEM